MSGQNTLRCSGAKCGRRMLVRQKRALSVITIVLMGRLNLAPSMIQNMRVFSSQLSSTFFLSASSTVSEIFKNTKLYFESCGVDDSETSARYLISDAADIGYKYSDFQQHMNSKLSQAQITRLQSHCERRVNKEPVQYIIGNWDFYGFTLFCKRPVLIPRPETEELVELIINSGVLGEVAKPRILDIGSGTGAIGIALLSKYPSAECVAIDVNEACVSLSNLNAKTVLGNGAKYDCKHMSFQDFVVSLSEGDQEAFDLIVSNPPYIPSEEMTTLQAEVALFEDHVALHGGLDGLDLIKDIILNAPTLVRKSGPKEIWMEVSHTHPAKIEAWMRAPGAAYSGENGGAVVFRAGMKDLSGHPRFVRLVVR